MGKLAVIVGTTSLEEQFADAAVTRVDVSTETPWGQTSGVPLNVVLPNTSLEFVVLYRHGEQADINPHAINYRANIWLLRELGVDGVISTNTVGGIDPALEVGSLVLPDQVIDYTWGRESTYDDERRHIEFTEPYTETLRQRILAADASIFDGGTYAATQGPRLETAAEVRRLARDGCTVVGMTGMPEAALACELELPYVSVCIIVNPAAGVVPGAVDMDALRAASIAGADRIGMLLRALAD